jgi:hypothetical protein
MPREPGGTQKILSLSASLGDEKRFQNLTVALADKAQPNEKAEHIQ